MTDLSLDVRTVLDDFELGIDLNLDFQRLGIFGPSGSGKTTILDILAGLREPEHGRIVVDDTVWFDRDRSINRAPEARRIGYLMQDARLFPHRTVEENLRFGDHDPNRVSLDKLVDILEIAPLMERTPDSLSGGERRRVALAQVLNAGPDLLLLDEPLTGLNESLRDEVLPAIRRVITGMNVPSVVVAHRPVIMRSLANTVVPLKEGRASEVYEVSQFFQNNRLRDREILGETNYYEVTIRETNPETGLIRAETDAGLNFQLLGSHGLGEGDRAQVSFSSREPIIGTTQPESLSPRNHWEASVEQIESKDGSTLLTLNMGGETVWVRVTDETIRELGIESGQSIDVLIKSHSLNVRTL